MREYINQQHKLRPVFNESEHEHVRELSVMDRVLKALPEAIKLVEADLTKRKLDRGRPGMTAEQVVRVLVIKQMNGFSYEDLAFHLADSKSYGSFCRLSAFDSAPKKSTLQGNIKRITSETLRRINDQILVYGQREGIENGKKVRVDSTVVETHIHHPTDSSLLWDVNRKLVSLMKKARRQHGVTFVSHYRRSKRRSLEISNTKTMLKRVPLYRDLVRVSEDTLANAERILVEIRRKGTKRLVSQLRQYVEIGRQVVAQTRSRVFQNEKVSAEDKIVSIFEPHTDIIRKGGRDTSYGHKLFLTTGISLVTDCRIEVGNPADSSMAVPMIERHAELYGRVPEQAAYDGGFATRENLTTLKERGVKDVAFNKRQYLKVSDMVGSSWIYKRLSRFRAGIEGVISFLKRCFGLGRCAWSGFESFQSYVWGSVVAANLLTIARHKLV